MPHIPSLGDRTAAAVELGLIEPGEPLPPRLQSKMAKVIGLAGEMQLEESAPVRDPAVEIADARKRLVEAGISGDELTYVLASIAPIIWREKTGAAHAR